MLEVIADIIVFLSFFVAVVVIIIIIVASPISYSKGFGDMNRSMERFTFASALDLNMGNYHIKINADAQKLCTIVFPWQMGKNTNTNAYP
jgi:hypothetical protein